MPEQTEEYKLFYFIETEYKVKLQRRYHKSKINRHDKS